MLPNGNMGDEAVAIPPLAEVGAVVEGAATPQAAGPALTFPLTGYVVQQSIFPSYFFSQNLCLGGRERRQ